jgi:putative DNA primase/helicase
MSNPNLGHQPINENMSTLIKISNKEFLTTIFGDDAPYSHVTGFYDDPSNITNDRRSIAWCGDYASRLELQSNTNQYFTISLFHADTTQKARRRKALYRQTNCVVLDDVVEKLSLEAAKRLPEPSWILETSSGSYQWGYILDYPCTSINMIDNLNDGLIASDLAPKGADPGMRGVTRYVRLPEGVNTKAMKLNSDGTPYKCQMREWHPERRTSLADLAAPFGIDLHAERRDSRVDGAADIPDHPLLSTPFLEIKRGSGGKFDVTCPWVEGHTGQADDGAAIFTNEDGSLGFKCHHGACQERTGYDLINDLEYKQPGFREAYRSWLVTYNFKRIGVPSTVSAPTPIREITKEAVSTSMLVRDKWDNSVIKNIAALERDQKTTKSEISQLYHQAKQQFNVGISDLKKDVQLELSGGELSQIKLVAKVIDCIGTDKLIYVDQSFHEWTASGYWSKANDEKIKKIIHMVLEINKPQFTARLVNELLSLLRTELYRPDIRFNRNRTIINTRSGELHFDEETSTWQLKNHNLMNYCSAQLPIKYDEKAKAPMFVKFLTEVFEGSDDAASKILIVQEMMGYSLLADCQFEKFIILVGNGANGKSVLLGLVEALVGDKNVCAIQPARLDNPFSRAHLHGKFVNVVTELEVGATIADQQLKALSSGDLMTAEHKMKAPFEFHPFATCWFGTNHLPSTKDFSGALFRRAIVLDFPNQFIGDRSDTKLLSKLKGELSGILLLALNAYADVLSREGFTECQSAQNMLDQWRLNTDQVEQFVEDQCVCGPLLEIEVSVLYMAYQAWAGREGIKRMLSKRSFGQRLDGLGYKSRRKSTQRIRVGVTLSVFDSKKEPLSFF